MPASYDGVVSKALLLVSVLGAAACVRPDPFRCNQDRDCELAGEPGRCEQGACVVRGGGELVDASPTSSTDAPDRPALGEELQLIGVAHNGFSGTNNRGWRVLARVTGERTWTVVRETAAEDSSCDAVAWADSLGGADHLPELLIRCWHKPYVQRLATSAEDGVIGLTHVGLQDGGGNTERGDALWADVDGDGDLDVVRGHPALAIHELDGGGFDLKAPLASGEHGLALASWDDDAEPELATGSAAGVAVRERVGTGWGAPITIDGSTDDVRRVMWCDLRGDRRPDLLAMGGLWLRIYRNLGAAGGNGSWLDGANPVTVATGIGDPWGPMVCGDLDGDGLDDLVFRTYDRTFIVMHGSGSTMELGSQLRPNGLGLADVDDDGKLDLLIARGQDAYGVVEVMRNASTAGDVRLLPAEPILTVNDPAVGFAVTRIPRPTTGPPR